MIQIYHKKNNFIKAFVWMLMLCTSIYFLAKATLKPRITEIRNHTSNQNCSPINTKNTNENLHNSDYIILNRTSVILQQSKRQKNRN